MSRWFVLLLVACGGSPPHPPAGPVVPALQPSVAGLQWYRALSTCAQGPYEVTLDASHARYGEDFELQLHTPRKLALDAVILVDGTEVDRTHGVFDARGSAGGKPDNAKCIADAHERLVLGRTGGTATPGTPATPGTLVPNDPARPSTTAQLQLETGLVTDSTSIIHVHLRDKPARTITIRFWSVEPNDLAGVLFGAAHVVWRPNVSDADYEAYLVREQQRAEAEARARVVVVRADAPPPPRVDPEAEAARRRALEEEARRRQIQAALEAERARLHEIYCNAHHDDTDCWGAGGYRMHAALDLKAAERTRYCAAHAEDARCWTDDEWHRHREAWGHRVDLALAPPKQPDGPPPARLAEMQPPKLSVHAEWRPGYWQWTESTWVWLAGQWRVPEADIVAEQTATAPAPPPPPQVETAPAAPVRTAVWVAGYWMWNGTSWVWLAGSYQLRPEPRVEWRAPVWRAKGSVQILIPGQWVRR